MIVINSERNECETDVNKIEKEKKISGSVSEREEADEHVKSGEGEIFLSYKLYSQNLLFILFR